MSVAAHVARDFPATAQVIARRLETPHGDHGQNGLVFHTNASFPPSIVLRLARARTYLPRMASADLVHPKGLGSALWHSR